jgi:hypothetical protein
MARKTTKKGKAAARKTAPKRTARAKTPKRSTAKKARKAPAKKATSVLSKAADAFGASDLLRAWSSTRYSR